MKFRPLHDRVVIERIDPEAKTAGGIIIPDTAQEKPQQGKVIAIGPGGRDENGKLIPIDVKVGNRILFGKWSGTEVKIDGVEYLIMKESDIMGVLVEAEAKNEARKKGSESKRRVVRCVAAIRHWGASHRFRHLVIAGILLSASLFFGCSKPARARDHHIFRF